MEIITIYGGWKIRFAGREWKSEPRKEGGSEVEREKEIQGRDGGREGERDAREERRENEIQEGKWD